MNQRSRPAAFPLCILLSCALTLPLGAQTKPAPGNEPTNAAEAAAKKAAQQKATDEKFQAWKATLSPEQQAWETVLEANLGTFYLPLYKADKVAKRTTAWDYVQDDPKLPRVLLIGDSVSRGYTLAARKALAGKANVHRAPENCGPTTNGLKKLDVWLHDGQDGKWDVIHFNFGIHDRRTPPADYEQRLEEIVARLEKTGAKLIWATTTPVPPDLRRTQGGSSITTITVAPDATEGPAATAAIVERNAIAARVMEKHHVAIDDLFTFITPRLAEVQNPQDVHFTSAGYDLLGGQVAASIEQQLRGN